MCIYSTSTAKEGKSWLFPESLYRIKTNITYIVNLFDINEQSHSFLGRGFNFSFTWAAILSRSFLPCGVSFLPPVAVSFSTSFIPSRDCRTLRATDELPLQKWLGAVPFLLRPLNRSIQHQIQPKNTIKPHFLGKRKFRLFLIPSIC